MTQFPQSIFGLLQTLLAFKTEGQGHNPNGQNIQGPAGLGQYRSSTSSRSAPQTSRNKDHFGVGSNQFLEIFHGFHRSLSANLGLITRPSPFRQKRTQLQTIPDQIALQSLVIGIANQKVHVLDAFLKHVIHRVASCTSDTDNLDDGVGVGTQAELKIAHCVHRLDLKIMVKVNYKF